MTDEENPVVRFIGWVSVVAWFMVSYAIMHAAGASEERRLAIGTAVLLMAVIGYPLGRLLGYFLARDGDVDARGYQIVAWASLLGWVVPAIGAAISTMTWRFALRSRDNGIRYACLSTAGTFLAIGFAAYGAWTSVPPAATAHVPIGASTAPAGRSDPVLSSGPHTTQRCAFSYLERWPAQDVETYCSPEAVRAAGPGA